MKTRLFLFMLLAAMVFTGCSSDDNIVAGDNGSDGDNDRGYIAVSIAQPSGTRASETDANTGSFEDGTAAENAAKRGLFFIFKSDGNILGEPQNVNLTPSTAADVASNIEKIYDAVIVVDGVKKDDKPEAGIQIACVLNAPVALQSGITTLDQLKEEIGNYGDCKEGKFIMTNSVYKSDGFGVKVEEKNIASTNSEALKNPVEIHVERVVAKVKASVDASIGELKTGEDTYADGEVANFKIKVTGIEVANAGGNSYLFKNTSGFTDTENSWAWDEPNFRSYWETVPPLTSNESGKKVFTILNRSYNTIVDNSPKNDGAVNPAFDFAKLTSDNPYTTYVQPNTCDEETKKSAILVTAQLLEEVEENGETKDKPVELVYLRGGYYHHDKALAIIAQHVANKGYYKKKDDNKFEQLDATDFEWTQELKGTKLTWLKDYEVVARVKDNVTKVYKKDDSTDKWSENEINTGEIDEMLAGSETDSPYKARYYKEGRCYYYVPIVHHTKPATGTEAATVYKGVVRNHVYKLTIKSIHGFGVPVFNPDYAIIPETPQGEELLYIAAKVDVLPWKIVSQEVNFNN